MKRHTIIFISCLFGILLAAKIHAAETTGIRDEITLIAIEDKTFGPEFRGKHAELVKRLSEVGTRVIVFDLFFEDPVPEHDERFLDAIEQARSRGTDVVVGFNGWREGGSLNETGPMIDPLYEKAVSGCGIACGGIAEGWINAPVEIIKDGNNHVYSLCLEAVKCYLGGNDMDIDTEFKKITIKRRHSKGKSREKQVIRTFDFPYLKTVKAQSGCPAIGEQDQVVGIEIDQSSIKGFRDPKRRFIYRDVLDKMEPKDLVKYFNSKIVLIGLQNGLQDVHPCDMGDCHGVELHAAAINTILNAIE